MSYAPILLFVYNRLEHTRRCVASLRQNSLAAESDLFVYSDGAKDPNGWKKVEEVRKFVHSIEGFKSVTAIESESNRGLAESIIRGVTEKITIYGKVIVVEDDLILAPYFLSFMNDALEIYKDEPKVGHVQACDYVRNDKLPDTFLIKWTGSWGWATWKRAWKYFNPDGKALLRELRQRKLTHAFDFDGKYGYTRMLRRQTEGKNDSWAIRWNASLFLRDILSLNVGKSLVRNAGFDGTGTNAGGGGLYSSELYMHRLTVDRIVPVEENEQARNAYSDYYARTNSFRAKAIRRIKRMLRGDFGA